MAEVKLTINGQEITASSDDTILTAAAKNGITIPTLCFMKDCNQIAACRICVVEVTGRRGVVPSCVTKVAEGMEVQTESERIQKARRITLDMLCKNHRMICDQCSRYSDCEFHALCRRYGISERDYNPYVMDADKDESAPHLVRDTSKCVLCQRCVAACHEQGMDIIAVFNRGRNKKVAPPLPLAQTGCVGCGQCVAACPTGALSVKDDTAELRNIIRQKKKQVVAVVAPGVGEGFAKLFYEKEPEDHLGKIAAMLRKLGVQRVYPETAAKAALFAAERVELETRKETGAALPMISEMSPAVVNLVEKHYPQFKENLSGKGTLQAMCANLARKAYADERGMPMEDILAVYISNDLSGKTEQTDGLMTLTTYELAAMFRRACVSRFTAMKVWREQLADEPLDSLVGALADESPDSPAGVPADEPLDSSAGVLAADSLAADTVSANVLSADAASADTGREGIRLKAGDVSQNAVSLYGLANVRAVLDKVTKGECPADYIYAQPYTDERIQGGAPRYTSADSLER